MSAAPQRFVIGLLVLVVGITLAPAAADAAGQADPAEIEVLKKELVHLKKQLGSKRADNAELIEYMTAAAKAYGELDPKRHAALRKQVYDLLLRGMRFWKLKQTENVRTPVNIQAATLFGELVPKLDKKTKAKLARTTERLLDELPKARYDVENEHIEALANLLARIGDARSMAFLTREYLRTDRKLIPYIIAAMKATQRFETVAPKTRYELVDRSVVLYAPLETAAETSSKTPATQSKKATWDEIRTHVIAMMQKMARTPVNEKGEALNTVHEFQVWIRHNDNPRRAPWVVEETKAAGAKR